MYCAMVAFQKDIIINKSTASRAGLISCYFILDPPDSDSHAGLSKDQRERVYLGKKENRRLANTADASLFDGLFSNDLW